MSGRSPFVVVLAAAAAGVGQSTLTENLAVYLKGLAEDLPVAVISFDPARDLAQTFEIAGHQAADIWGQLGAEGLESYLTTGQFGVEYLTAQGLPGLSPAALRDLLRATSFPGIFIIDAGPLTHSGATSAVQAADLVLAPVRDAAGLAPLAGIRRQLKKGGGHDQMLCLVPAMIDDPREQKRQLELLRFSAMERGCLVLDGEYIRDERLAELTSGVGGTVLTRMPQSQAHELLQKLARFVLLRFAEGPDSACRLQRLRQDAVLPRRARRVDLICPLCQLLVWQENAHYCESLPYRKRWLAHADCLNRLMMARQLQPFWSSSRPLVLRTGLEGRGLAPALKLLIAQDDGSVLETEQLLPAAVPGWPALVRRGTGRTLAEQLPGLIVLYPAKACLQSLSDAWYLDCVKLRGRLRAGLAAEL